MTGSAQATCLECGGSGVKVGRGGFFYCVCVPDTVKWRDAHIPTRYHDAPLSTKPISGSVFIQGPPGRGKTRAAIGMLKSWATKRMGGLFCDLIALEEARREAVGNKSVAPGRQFILAPLLVGDDLGRNDRLTDYWREFLTSLITMRYGKKLPTIWTSNYSLKELDNVLGTYLTGRIVEDIQDRNYTMTGKDWRREGQ